MGGPYTPTPTPMLTLADDPPVDPQPSVVMIAAVRVAVAHVFGPRIISFRPECPRRRAIFESRTHRLSDRGVVLRFRF